MILAEDAKEWEVPLIRIDLTSEAYVRGREGANLLGALHGDVIKKDKKSYLVTRRVYEKAEDGKWYMTILGREIR